MRITLDEFKELANDAFRWTSFDAKSAAEKTLLKYEDILNEDLKDMPESEQGRYVENYKRYFSSWLYAYSNCASPAVTGGSKFNIYKAEKANNTEHARYEAFINWRERALKAIKRKAEESQPEAQKIDKAWEALKSEILWSANIIHGINTGSEQGFSKALFVSSIYNKVATFAKHGNVEVVQKAIEFIRNFNKTKSVVITERHKFFKLAEVAEANRQRKQNK